MSTAQTYGFACLVLGAGLVVAQVVVAWMAARTKPAIPTDVVRDVSAAADAVGQVRATLPVGLESTSAEAVSRALDRAEASANQAKEKTEAAADGKGQGANDVLSVIAGSMPLGVLGFLFVTLGAAVLDLLDVVVGVQ